MRARHRWRASIVAVALLIPSIRMMPWAPATGQGVGARVLLMAGDGKEPTFTAWTRALDAHGTPYDTLIAATTEIDAAMLRVGPGHGKYQALISTTDNLTYRHPQQGWISALSAQERAALEAYQSEFGVRRVSTYASPKSALGMESATWSGVFTNLRATVTDAGRATLPGLRDSIPIDGVWGYTATPKAGAAVTPLLVHPNGATLGATLRHTDGREEMFFTFDAAWTSVHLKLLAHPVLSWATRDVMIGAWRNHLTVHVDDVFLESARWDPATNRSMGSQGDPLIRMTASDVERAAAWSSRTGVHLDLLFNALGSTATIARTGSDALTDALLEHRDAFAWVSHTWSHANLSASTAAQIEDELTLNKGWAEQNQIAIDPGSVVTGGHTGLSNPNMAPALASTGTSYVGSGAGSAPSTMLGSSRVIPRHPNLIAFDTAKRVEALDRYNHTRYEVCAGQPGCLNGPADWSTFVSRVAQEFLARMIANDPRPFFVHQANLAEDAILLEILDEALRLYEMDRDTPLEQPSFSEAGRMLARSQAWAAARDQVVTVIGPGTLTITSPTSIEVPVTGTEAGTRYGKERSGWVAVPANEPVTLRALGRQAADLPPVASDITATGTEDNAIPIALAAQDPDGDPITYELVTLPAHGTLSGEGASLTYMPDRDHWGTDTFAYRARDAAGVSNTATVTLQISAVNDIPVAHPKGAATRPGVPVMLDLSAGDADGDTLSFEIAVPPARGTLSAPGSVQCSSTPAWTCVSSVSYTPLPSSLGPDSFAVRVRDGSSASLSASVQIDVRNSAPDVHRVSVTTEEDVPVAVTLPATDADGDPLRYDMGSPEAGALVGTAPHLTYIPDADASGSDGFDYRVGDGYSWSASSVAIEVTAVDDAPVAHPSHVVAGAAPVEIVLTAHDVDGPAPSIEVVEHPTGLLGALGEHSCHTTGPRVECSVPATYTAGDQASDTIKFRASGGGGHSETATVTIEVTDRAPVARDIAVSTVQPAPVALTLEASDPDGDALAFEVSASPAGGTLSGSAPNLVYTPHGWFTGPDTFTFTVTDGNSSAQGRVDISVVARPIAFSSDRSGNSDVFIMEADGSGQTRLTTHPSLDYAAGLWPDASKVVFTSARDGNYEIYSMRADGSQQTRLTSNPARDTDAMVSPDGTRIVFASQRTGSGDIYVMNADGTGVTRLTDDPGIEGSPVWSPDGTEIAFGRRGTSDRVMIMNADGSHARVIASNWMEETRMDWSPDGTHLVYTGVPGQTEIYTIKVDGTDQRRLTHRVGVDRHPAWSPDGTRIVFASDLPGMSNIHTMRTDGTDIVRLTSSIYDTRPQW